MTDDETKPRSSLAVWLIVAIVLLPALYVLSLGPAVWCFERGYFQWLMWIYTPLDLLAFYCPPFARVMLWYLAFWQSPSAGIQPIYVD